MPTTNATTSAPPSATAAPAGRRRRRFGSSRRGGAGASARTRSRSASDASGRPARSSWTSSSCDTAAHLLLEPLQRAAEPRRAGRRADSEDLTGALAVQVEHDSQRDHRPVGGGQLRERALELRRQALAERRLVRLRHLERESALTPPAPLFGAEVVQRRRARELAEPRAGAPPARVVPPPALKRPGESLCCQVFWHRSVSRQVHEECVHVVQVALGRLGEVVRARLHATYTPPAGAHVTRCEPLLRRRGRG